VVAWGCGAFSDFGQCSVPSGLSGVTAIAPATPSAWIESLTAVEKLATDALNQ
jgi:hypothetical protein